MLAGTLLAGLALALGAPGAPHGAAGAEPPRGAAWAEPARGALRRSADLGLHLRPGMIGADPVAVPEETRRGPPPPCLGEICQPRVEVPGLEPHWERPHRSELFVLALTRAHAEPFASLAWALVATGLRVDWTPVALDGAGAGAHGWGSVFLRLRLRLDADNVPVLAHRPR